MNMFTVIYWYSPNGRDDKGESSACASDGLAFRTKEEACAYVKGKFESLALAEREKGSELDAEWGERVSEQDMKDMGYSWNPDFSRLSFEYESRFPDVPPEPKFSWTVEELVFADEANG